MNWKINAIWISEKLPFTISTDGFRHTTERVSTIKYGEVYAYTFHVANCLKKNLNLNFSTLSSKGGKLLSNTMIRFHTMIRLLTLMAMVKACYE